MKNLLIVLLFAPYSIMDYTNRSIENGLLYGQNKGFFPQVAVFIHIKDHVALAEGFYPLKGMLFATFTDTLYYHEEKNIFSNEKSNLYVTDNKIYFERRDSLLAFRVEKTRLKYAIGNESKYAFFKEKAIPYKQ